VRRSVAFIAVLAAVLLVLPAVFGWRTESIVRERIESMDESAVTSIRVESYDRGWFGSTAHIGVGIDGGGASALAATFLADTTFTVVLEIDHGPLMINDFYVGLSRFAARLNEESAVVSELQTRLAMPYLAELRGRIGLTGSFTYDADVPPIDYADESGELDFSGARFDGSVTNGRILTNGRVDSIVYDGRDGAASISGIRLAGDNFRASRFVLGGTMSMAVDELLVRDSFGSPDPIAEMRNFEISSEVDIDDTDGLMNATVTYSVDEVRSPAQSVDVQELEIALHMLNFDLAVLDGYYEAVFANPFDESAGQEAVAGLLSTALDRSPSFSIDPLRFRYDGEPVDAALEIRVDADAVPADLDVTNILAITSALQANARITASKTFASRIAADIISGQLAAAGTGQQLPPGQGLEAMAEAQAQLMLAALLGQGVIVSEGDNYTSTIDYSDGELTVNGEPAPLGFF